MKFARFEKFAKISRKSKAHDRAVAWMHHPRVPKWKAKAAWKAPRLHIERVAIDDDIDKTRLPPTEAPVILGRARGERMDLLIVGAMGYLHKLGANASQQLCDLIFVVGKGLPVIGASTWRAVGGDPKKLASEQVVFHKAASQVKVVVFQYTGNFRMENPEVMRALDTCAAWPKSKWKVQFKSGPQAGMPLAAPAHDTDSELVEITSLASLGHWIINARVLQKWGCKGFGVMSG